MKKVRKNAVIAVLIALSLLFTTACGGSGDSGGNDESAAYAFFAGAWEADTSSYDGIVISEDGSWELYKNGGLYSSGELSYMEEGVWISPENNTQWSRLSIENGGCLYAAPIGYFRLVEGDWDGTFGGDWRENGSVVDRGFICRDDIGEVYVLVTVDDDSVSFYMDEREQILFDCLFFPLTIPNAQDNYFGISFDDRDGDGESDVSLSLYTPEGVGYLLVWLWDPDYGYEFQEDWSVIGSGSEETDESMTDFNGYWEYDDGSVVLIEDDNWFLYTADEHDLIWWGPMEYEGGTAYLKTSDGDEVGKYYVDEYGYVVDSGYSLIYLGTSVDW